MLELRAIGKNFGVKKTAKNIDKDRVVKALADISLTINSDEVFGIVGKSGAGKSTLLRLLSLHIQPDAGSIRMFDETVDKHSTPKVRRQLVQQTSFVFQGFSLLYNYSVIDNIALPLTLRGVDVKARRAKALDLLTFVGLADKAENYPITLSGGEAQRVSIARALISDPKIIFFDEPTSALDAQTMKDILDLLKKVHQSYSVTMVLVSHQMDVIRYMCDRAVWLENGTIKKIAEVEKVHDFPVDQLNDLWVNNNA